MDDKLVLYESHYERVVNYLINQYQFSLSYQDYLEGFNLFTLGTSLGYKNPVSILKNFLEIAKVKTKNTKELRVVFKIKKRLQNI